MSLSPNEAEEELVVIQRMMQKTRHSFLAPIGYFLLPGIFYAWMGVLGGGGMIALALYMRWRW
jgi:hypothetical protein